MAVYMKKYVFFRIRRRTRAIILETYWFLSVPGSEKLTNSDYPRCGTTITIVQFISGLTNRSHKNFRKILSEIDSYIGRYSIMITKFRDVKSTFSPINQ